MNERTIMPKILPHYSYKQLKNEQVSESLPLYQDLISKMPLLKRKELEAILTALNESGGNVSIAAKN
ncbi:hypothetical protein ACI2OX_18240 [Bacillus sp. N9]